MEREHETLPVKAGEGTEDSDTSDDLEGISGEASGQGLRPVGPIIAQIVIDLFWPEAGS